MHPRVIREAKALIAVQAATDILKDYRDGMFAFLTHPHKEASVWF
jgi:hypothetical protein